MQTHAHFYHAVDITFNYNIREPLQGLRENSRFRKLVFGRDKKKKINFKVHI